MSDTVVALGVCQWFARCTRQATHIEAHPLLETVTPDGSTVSGVPCCERCATVGR